MGNMLSEENKKAIAHESVILGGGASMAVLIWGALSYLNLLWIPGMHIFLILFVFSATLTYDQTNYPTEATHKDYWMRLATDVGMFFVSIFMAGPVVFLLGPPVPQGFTKIILSMMGMICLLAVIRTAYFIICLSGKSSDTPAPTSGT